MGDTKCMCQHLGVSIIAMTKNIMEKLQFPNLSLTPAILKLAYRSIVKIKGALKYVVISIDSWEYLVNFMVLWLNSSLNGYPLIPGRAWITTIDSYIGCRSEDMTISHGIT